MFAKWALKTKLFLKNRRIIDKRKKNLKKDYLKLQYSKPII